MTMPINVEIGVSCNFFVLFFSFALKFKLYHDTSAQPMKHTLPIYLKNSGTIQHTKNGASLSAMYRTLP